MSTELDVYTDSFCYSNVQFNIICNQLVPVSQLSSHEGQECTPFMGWVMARKSKAASNVTYNPDDPPSAYSNPSVHSRIQAYTEMGRQVHGADWDPRTQPLDGEVIMRVGGGKKHGHYYISDGLVDTPALPPSPRFERGARP